ncbi:two-component sensor histidine kinase [Paractinoplanes abujensis]|uniref:histidine kinase n=1 Tax=Paractinoplanes abujensis TaxID=882441 RepID=A0A7W7G188_9ACTN|nr:ATP-binding protein [Actinoplanes abujensis]MBB4692379.1 signal transduction histidine kinase [Actinoplanes abujensis]GID24144.1 two-component sensor histidine kinase [Actinoplanes abujensis]
MRRAGLRTRVSAAFAIGALALSAGVTFVSYELISNTLFRERERAAVRVTYFDATVINAGLGGSEPEVGNLLESLDIGADRYVLLFRQGQWYSRTAGASADSAVPEKLQELAATGQAGAQRIRRDGEAALVVAVPVQGGSVFYEIVSLGELERTLNLLALVLTAVAIMVSAGGAAVGWYVTRHALRPLAAVAEAASGIADGDLDTRLDPDAEPELARLAASFNHMADELSRRLRRDRRFAADVSHELRSPLQTLAAAVSVLNRRRDGLDERSAAAVGLIADEVARFQALVDDLLELARSDQPVHREPADIGLLAGRVLRDRGLPADLIELVPGTPVDWHVDRRRVEQALGNLVDNAVRYGGGPVAVRVGPGFLEVDDAGPGVPAESRSTIFDRFVRGPAANSRGGGDGTGLGLAIVAEHAAAHDGRIVLLDRPGGGARFRLELPDE